MKKDILNNTMRHMNATGRYYNVLNTGVTIWRGGAQPTNTTGTTAGGNANNTSTGTILQQGGNMDTDESGTQNMGGTSPGNNKMATPPKSTNPPVIGPYRGGPKPTFPAGVTTNPKTVAQQATARPGDNKSTRENTDDPTQPGYIDPKEYDRTHDLHGNLIVNPNGKGGETPDIGPDVPGPSTKKSIIPGLSNTYLWVSVGVLVVGGVLLYIRHKRK